MAVSPFSAPAGYPLGGGVGGVGFRVHVLGGGPGGLYAALLLKKNHPDWHVTVHERNPRGATYGWGVVFSDRTLTGLRESDFKSYSDITESFVLWEAIDIHHRDQLVRCDGHAFAGIGRKKMLNILQQRCEELGVELRFEVEVTDVEALQQDSDLLVAADGVNSRVRQLHADRFGPSTNEGHARYVWFGTDKVYDSFTFIFRETEHGLFQVHIYPFDATTSTFIVECSEETWRGAGLDEMDEQESLAFCEHLFADHLGGRRLLTNRSQWLSFTTLKNRRWSFENVVLLGDAVHTAHFSIGSGTKLALEDAIALANGFEVYPDDIPAALRHYEQARRPRVEATQRAAAESQRYFETVARYRDFHPLQFAFHLLTRSGRITYDNLKQRDPYFVADVERWFQQHSTGEAVLPLVAPPPMLTPLTLRGVTLPNRFVVMPRTATNATDGRLDDDARAELGRLCHAGAGLVLADAIAVSSDGRITPADFGLYTPEHQLCWQHVVSELHTSSPTLLGITLSHAGRRGATRPRGSGLDRLLRDGGWPLVAPSAIPYGRGSQAPKAMDASDLQRVCDFFTAAACMAAQAGADLLQLDMSRGYLLGSFLSPLTNRRDDEFGGSLEHRLRFPLRVLDAVRAVWSAQKPLAVAVSASDWQRGGNRLTDGVAIARALKDHGCDLVTVYAGQTTPGASPHYDVETLAHYSDVIRTEAGIATLATPYITTSNQANTLLAGGRCDVCVFWPRMLR